MSDWSPVVWMYGESSQKRQGAATQLSEGRPNLPRDKPIVLWTTSNWSDRLVLWWLLETVERENLDITRFHLAEARSAFASADCETPDPFPVSCVPAERLRTAFDARVALTADLTSLGASLWRKYADSDPTAFDAVRRRGCSAFPELKCSARIYGAFFPRLEATSERIRLSQLDQSFLEGFSTDAWLSPLEVIRVSRWAQDLRQNSPHGESPAEIDEWLRTTGNDLGFDGSVLRRLVDDRVKSKKKDRSTQLFDQLCSETLFPFRLSQWARHQPDDPLVEPRPGPNTINQLMWVSYRLTARGQRLLDDGLVAGDDAPPMFAGGCELYRPNSFYVRQQSGDSWSIVPAH
jgi:hypothetical protein